MSLFAELKRRNVIRAALAYGVSAWVLVQVLEIATDAFEAPAWVLKIVITLLALLAVPVLLFSWVYEMTPDGLRRESDLEATAPRSDTGGRFNVAIVVLLMTAVGLAAWQRLAPPGELAGAHLTQPVAGDSAVPEPTDRKSIAVLPFENFSGSEDDRYFSDGLSDTLLHRLAQLDDLTVIARNSSFVYKGSNVDVRQVGAELGVGTVLEGSVQRQGDRLRVIAQLVETETGSHLWSETYDRAMADIFSIQDEIAGAVADALELELLGEERERLTRSGTNDELAWAFYLESRKLAEENVTGNRYEIVEILTQALERDPEFIEAYHGLAGAYDLIAWLTDDPDENAEALANGFEAVDRAIAIDPGHPDNLLSLARIQRRSGNSIRASALLEQYLRQSPSDSSALMQAGLAYHQSLDHEAAYDRFLRAHRLDPLRPLHYRQLAFTAVELGDPATAIDWLRRGIERFDSNMLAGDLENHLTGRYGAWRDGLQLWIDYPVSSVEDGAWRARTLTLRLLQLGRYEDARAVIAVIRDAMGLPERAAGLSALLAMHESPEQYLEATDEAASSSRSLFVGNLDLRAVTCSFHRRNACVIELLGTETERFVSDFSPTPILSSRYDLVVASLLGLALQRAGEVEAGRELLDVARSRMEARRAGMSCEQDCRDVLSLAELRAATGDRNGALAALEASLPADGEGFVYNGVIQETPIIHSPFLDSLRGDPRFEAWLAELERRRGAMRTALEPELREIMAQFGIDGDEASTSGAGS